MELKCPANILHEKEWRAANGNRCNALFLTELMRDGESIRKMFHSTGGLHKHYPVIEALYRYYKNHNKKELLDTVEALTHGVSGARGSIFVGTNDEGKRILRDWSSQGLVSGIDESDWADLSAYERRATKRITDEWGSNQSVYYDNKSVAEVLKATIESTTLLGKQIYQKTGNPKLDLLVQNLLNNSTQQSDYTYLPTKSKDKNVCGTFHLPTYFSALKEINHDLSTAFENQEPLNQYTYMPIIILLDETSTEVFNQIDYKQQRVFHKSALGQEMLKFSYLTTQNLHAKNEEGCPDELKFSVEKMNQWLTDIQNTDLWQVAQRKISAALIERLSHQVSVGSLLNNQLMTLISIKPKPEEPMYAAYWHEDNQRASYMNLYIKPVDRSL